MEHSDWRIINTSFVKTATRPENCPQSDLPEVAFIGRSNVGKSSLLNALCGRKSLARTSSTPGRTQAINFFSVFFRSSVNQPEIETLFADLPGFGFARVSHSMRGTWSKMAGRYFSGRPQLSLLLLLVDIRRELKAEEQLVLASRTELPLILVVTKSDKVQSSKRKHAINQLEKTAREYRKFPLNADEWLFPVSAFPRKLGMQALANQMAESLGGR
jgi:GTP-binding protein